MDSTKQYIYGVFDGDEVVFSGNASEVAKEFGVERDSIYKAVTLKSRFKYRYRIKPIGVRSKEVTDRDAQKWEYYTKHLKLYGNTVVRKEEEKHIKKLLEDLKARGFDCEVTKYVNRGSGEHLLLEGSRRVKRVDYVLKVKEV